MALCVGLAETMWRATAEQQPASLAAMIESMADPGSDRNPLRLDGAMLVPRVLNNQGAVAHAVLDEHGIEDDDEVFAVAAVVTRDGKVGTYELLQAGTAATGQHRGAAQRRGVADLLDAVRQSRFAPAQGPGGRTVAVNVVWLFAKTTVKASAMTVDLGVPLSAPVRSRRAVEVPESGAGRAGRAGRTPVRRRRSVSDGLSPAAGCTSPRALDTLFSASAARSTTPRLPVLFGQAQLELLGRASPRCRPSDRSAASGRRPASSPRAAPRSGRRARRRR